MKILVAEDDKVVSMLVCGILREQGHRTLAAYDQMQAIMFANKVPGPDAIVLDLNMPGGTGGETLRRLKTSTRTSHIPVVVLTGTTDERARATIPAERARSSRWQQPRSGRACARDRDF